MDPPSSPPLPLSFSLPLPPPLLSPFPLPVRPPLPEGSLTLALRAPPLSPALFNFDPGPSCLFLYHARRGGTFPGPLCNY